MTKTYILIGYDENHGNKGRANAWKKRADEMQDVEIIYAEPGKDIAASLKKINSPGNVILHAHGAESGQFQWNKDEIYKYSDLFKALPREGIESITIYSCYGGTATQEKMLEHAPPGTLVISKVGSEVPAIAEGTTKKLPGWEEETEIASHKKVTPLTILLEKLDEVNPEELISSLKWRKYTHWDFNKYCTDPNKVLPHIIGLGGEPPEQINLNDEMAILSAEAKKGLEGKESSFDKNAFKNAITVVKDHFDPSDFSTKTFTFTPRKNQLEKTIDDVAAKIGNGADTSKFSLNEKRIAYAITAANLFESGEMQRRIENVKLPLDQRKPKIKENHKETVLAQQPADTSITATTSVPTTNTEPSPALNPQAPVAPASPEETDVETKEKKIATPTKILPPSEAIADVQKPSIASPEAIADVQKPSTASPEVIADVQKPLITPPENPDLVVVKAFKEAMTKINDKGGLENLTVVYDSARAHFAEKGGAKDKIDQEGTHEHEGTQFRNAYIAANKDSDAKSIAEQWNKLEADANKGLADLMRKGNQQEIQEFVLKNRVFLDTDKDGFVDRSNSKEIVALLGGDITEKYKVEIETVKNALSTNGVSGGKKVETNTAPTAPQQQNTRERD